MRWPARGMRGADGQRRRAYAAACACAAALATASAAPASPFASYASMKIGTRVTSRKVKGWRQHQVRLAELPAAARLYKGTDRAAGGNGRGCSGPRE